MGKQKEISQGLSILSRNFSHLVQRNKRQLRYQVPKLKSLHFLMLPTIWIRFVEMPPTLIYVDNNGAIE